MKLNRFIAIPFLFVFVFLSSCDNTRLIQTEAHEALEHGNYKGALKKILELSDRQILDNDSLILMVSEAFYGLTGSYVGLNAQSLCDMDFSPNKDLVFFTDLKKGKIMKFAYPELSLLDSFDTPSGCYAVDISPSGKELAAALSNSDVLIYDLESFETIKTLKGHSNHVRALEYLDSNWLVSGGNDQYMILWDLQQNKMNNKQWPHRKNIKSIRAGEEGKYVVSASNDGTAIIWDVADRENPREIRKFKHGKNYVNDAMMSPDNSLLVTASGDGDLKIWNVKTFDLITTIPLEDVGCSIDFSPDGKTLMVGGYRNLHFIDVDRRKEIYKYPLANDPVWSVKFISPNKFAFIDSSHYYESELYSKEELVAHAREWLSQHQSE
ncbi:MAG: hypothetical protein J1D77_02800 [Muribaculaceae bacterium]|nr:hypothetical protein [Muribaculaceae bacterium]